MSELEEDREDLMAEATALVQRARLEADQLPEPLVVGFRRGGECSLYFDANRAYHFNDRSQLRRAFVGQLLYSADQGQLVAMRRQRGGEMVQLVARTLDAEETAKFMSELESLLTTLTAAIAAKRCVALQQIPPDGNILEQLRTWLTQLPRPVEIAARPHVH